MVPVDSDKITRVPPYSGYLIEFTIFRLQDFHLLRFSFPTNSAILKISYSYIKVLQPLSVDRFGLFPFRSPLLRESILFFLFLRLLRCFSSPGCCPYNYVFIIRRYHITGNRFPHSEISGSKLLTAPRSISLFVTSFFSF